MPPAAGDDSTLVKPSCLDDDAQGQRLDVRWEKELDSEPITREVWRKIAGKGFDPPLGTMQAEVPARWFDTRGIIFTEYGDTRRYLQQQLIAAIATTDRADEGIAID